MSMQLSTGVLFKENNNLVIIRGIEKETIEQIKSQYGKERCICYVGGQSVDYGPVKHALFWMDRVDIGD
ncbi:hypothetical protein [Ammoniphilus sp. CFH 90114]|uniref:hypothetical protein n=1 Tax=Ammoniphilus sp. CFH 90114 TaxID=2493665 RepID=UPI00100E461E|nr:hypothetical protein [Ammoniphilus sp. CFH 90114]RXT08828.1 hypothetical protein EIZ39_08490 [Ammoniphilus sp. CFH 90114]